MNFPTKMSILLLSILCAPIFSVSPAQLKDTIAPNASARTDYRLSFLTLSLAFIAATDQGYAIATAYSLLAAGLLYNNFEEKNTDNAKLVEAKKENEKLITCLEAAKAHGKDDPNCYKKINPRGFIGSFLEWKKTH